MTSVFIMKGEGGLKTQTQKRNTEGRDHVNTEAKNQSNAAPKPSNVKDYWQPLQIGRKKGFFCPD